MEIPEGEEGEKEILEEVIARNFPDWVKTINPHIQEAQHTLN